MRPLAWVAVLLVAAPAAADHVSDLDAEAPYACPGADCIPSIDAPLFDDGRDLADDDRVIGVVLDGDARAYPVRILNWHEIVNDRFAEAPVAVTYCPLCGTALVFDARAGNATLEFGVSGRLFHNDLVMYDRGTGSLWSQVLGEAIWGELHGSVLELVPSSTTTWSEWREAHPGTRALATPDTYPASMYARYPYDDYESNDRTLQPRATDDRRLHAKAWVYGVAVDEGAVAFVLPELRERGEASVDVGGARVAARWADAAPHATVERPGSPPRDVVGVSGFWFAWADFHPGTLLWPSDARPEQAGEAPGSPGRETPGPSAVALALSVLAVAAALAARRR